MNLFILQYYNEWWLEWEMLPIGIYLTEEEATEQLSIIKDKLGEKDSLVFDIKKINLSKVTSNVEYNKAGNNNYYIELNGKSYL